MLFLIIADLVAVVERFDAACQPLKDLLGVRRGEFGLWRRQWDGSG